MTTDPTRAAEIVVASKEARSAAADLYLAQQGEPHSPHDLATAEAIRSGLNDHWEVVQAFARFERDHMQRPTDTARAGEAWPPSEREGRRVMGCKCHRCVSEYTIANPLPKSKMWLRGLIDPRLHRMFLCEICGNKRCPHATDHRFACTNSNEPGQAGSRYAHPPTTGADQ
nr:hypothetical protein [Sphingomonas sp. Y57]